MSDCLKGIRFLLTLLLGVGALASAQDEINPFAPPKVVTVAPPTSQASPLDDYEFKGVFSLGGTVKVCVFNVKEKKSIWLKLGEQDEDTGLTATSFDNGRDVVTLKKGGRLRSITLNKPKIDPIKVTGKPAPTRPSPPVLGNGATTRPATQPAQSDEEVRARMQKVADEIRKRREMRRAIIEEGAPDRR